MGNAIGEKASRQATPREGHVMRTTDSQLTTATQLERIAWLSAQDKVKIFRCLMHHVDAESLRACYSLLDGRKQQE